MFQSVCNPYHNKSIEWHANTYTIPRVQAIVHSIQRTHIAIELKSYLCAYMCFLCVYWIWLEFLFDCFSLHSQKFATIHFVWYGLPIIDYPYIPHKIKQQFSIASSYTIHAFKKYFGLYLIPPHIDGMHSTVHSNWYHPCV